MLLKPQLRTQEGACVRMLQLAYAGCNSRTQAESHFGHLIFQKQIFAHLKGYIFHFNTISYWALKWPSAYTCGREPMHAYIARVSEAQERQVSCNNGRGLERILHHLGAIPNPIFSTLKILTWYIFKTQKSHGKNLRFTKKQ